MKPAYNSLEHIGRIIQQKDSNPFVLRGSDDFTEEKSFEIGLDHKRRLASSEEGPTGHAT